MTIDLDALEKLADEATARTVGGEWTHDEYGVRQIWAKSIKGGDTHIADVRGWGYFTGMGHGALGLTEDEGIEAQRQIGQFIAAANPATIKALIAELKEARAFAAEEIAFAFCAGFNDAIEREKWDDCYDFAAAKAKDYRNDRIRAFLARNGKGEG